MWYREDMLISSRHQFIFIHVPKVAGQSVVKALQPHAYALGNRYLDRLAYRLGIGIGSSHCRRARFAPHVYASELRERLPADAWNNYYKFAFVRNPWDWLVSLYHYILTCPIHAHHQAVKALPGFPAFARFAADNLGWCQSDLLVDGSGSILVDYVGRYETLSADFAHACQRIGIAVTLPHTNATKHRDYRAYYDERTRQLVADAFAEDIERFGYTFNQLTVTSATSE